MNEVDPGISKLLEDIHTSAKRILDRLQYETREEFLGSSGMDIQDIVVRRLTIIGEASAALLKKYPGFCMQNPTIPLRQAKGMRNAPVHDYNGIEWELVWETAREDLPKLMNSIAPFLTRSEATP